MRLPTLTAAILLLGFTFACGQKSEKTRTEARKNCDDSNDPECQEVRENLKRIAARKQQALESRNLREILATGVEQAYYQKLKELIEQGESYGSKRQQLEHQFGEQQQWVKAAIKGGVANLTSCQLSKEQCEQIASELDQLEAMLEQDNQNPLRTVMANIEILYRQELQANRWSSLADVGIVFAPLWDSLKEAASTFDPRQDLVICRIDTVFECRHLQRKIDELAMGNAGGVSPAKSLLLRQCLDERLQLLKLGLSLDDPAVQKTVRKLQLIDEWDLSFPQYAAEESQAVQEVFDAVGELYIGPSPVDAEGQAQISVVEAKAMPWSAYWYPKRGQEMFNGPYSPLGKFDRLAATYNLASHAAAWEAERFSPFEADWAGLCDAWALAAVLEPEPEQRLMLNGEVFEPADLKALLIKKYEGYKPLIFGRRYFGSAESDGMIQDLRPEAFHRLVEVLIGDKGSAFVIDEDPGPEVWSKPLYKMRWVVKADPQFKNAFLVKAWPTMVAHRSNPSSEVTTARDHKTPVYQYRLYVDPEKQRDGKFFVMSGEWIDDSRNHHPDMVVLPSPQDDAVNPLNPEVAKNLSILNKLFRQGTPVP